MKLFTKDIDKKLFQQYQMGNNLEEQVVVSKIFNPYGNGRWFLINSDPNDPDYLWAIVQMGDVVEMGSVSRKELESLRVGRFKFPLERDLGFSSVNAMQLYEGLNKGKFYEKGGMAKGSYMANGGNIENQYKGRTPKEVWDNLSKDQRQHFLYDHASQIEEYRGEEYGELSSKEIIKAYNSDYYLLDKLIQNRFDNHVREGQYAKGGYMANGGGVKWQDAKIGDSALVKSENKMGLILKDYGRKFHLKFVDGTQKTYDASELEFIKDEYADGGYMENGGVLKVSKGENGKYYWKFTFKNGKEEKSFDGFNSSADAQRDFQYRSKYFKMSDGGYMAKGGEVNMDVIVKTPKGLVTKKDFDGFSKREIIEWCEDRGWVYNQKGEKLGGQILKEYEFFIKTPTRYNVNLPKSKMADGGYMAKGGVTTGDLNSMIREYNEDGRSFELRGAYGNLELWSKGNRLEVGSKKDIYNALVKYRFNEKYAEGGVTVTDDRLKTMEQSDEERELELFIDNDVTLYNQRKFPIEKNLIKKVASGTFDINQAPKIYKYLIDDGIKKYTKDFGGISLSKSEKENLAKDYVNKFLDDADGGQFNEYIPKKYRMEDGGEMPKEIDSIFKELAEINKRVDEASEKLNDISNKDERPMGLTSDRIKATQEYKEAKMEFDRAVQRLEEFNSSEKFKEGQKYLRGFDRKEVNEIRRRYMAKGGFNQYGEPYGFDRDEYYDMISEYDRLGSFYEDAESDSERARLTVKMDALESKINAYERMEEGGETDEYAKGGNVPSIERRVAEVNAMIKEANEKGLEVVDEGQTWQAPMKYNPIKYTKGVLYISYEQLDLYKYNKGIGIEWEKKNYRVGANVINYTQSQALSEIARMYRKVLKRGYAEGGETDEYAKGGSINKKYSHFAINKKNNKIVNGWETVSDIESLKYYAKIDLEDMDLKPSDYNILSAKTLMARGINPYDSNNWAKNDEYADGGVMPSHKEISDDMYEGMNKIEDFFNSDNIEEIYEEQEGVGRGQSNIVIFKSGDKYLKAITDFGFDDFHTKYYFIELDKMAKGGVTFDEKVSSISKSLVKRKKVSPSVQKDYGKTYDKKEAIESAKRIAGAMRAKEMGKKKD